MKLPLLVYALVAVGISPSPHKFEYGFVERTMAIIVRGDTAYGEYTVGLSQATLLDVLANWEKESESNPLPATAQADDSGVSSIRTETKPEPGDSAPNKPEPSPTDKASADSDEFVEPNSRPKDAENESTHFISPELLSRLKTRGTSEIPKRLTITMDDQPVTLEKISEGVAPRHPFTMQIKFQFKIPKTKTCELKIVDSNFGEQTGAVRYALKASGDAFLLQSNVAPILVRAERVELKNLSLTERRSQTLIEAKLAVVQPVKE